MKRITSRQHPLVAEYRALARGRDKGSRVLLDGPHLVEEACRSGLRIESAVLVSGLLETAEGQSLAATLQAAGTELVEAPAAVLAAVSPVTTPSGIVAIARRPVRSLADVFAHPPQLAVIAIDLQDPGNVGALARAAEAGGATGLALCGASADPFGWKALRGSMGSLLRLAAVSGIGWEEAIAAAHAAGIRVIATTPRGGRDLRELDLTAPVAFVLGGEGPGLPEDAITAADIRLSIPMQSPVESLNVAVAGALLVYEAARQRAGVRRASATS